MTAFWGRFRLGLTLSRMSEEDTDAGGCRPKIYSRRGQEGVWDEDRGCPGKKINAKRACGSASRSGQPYSDPSSPFLFSSLQKHFTSFRWSSRCGIFVFEFWSNPNHQFDLVTLPISDNLDIFINLKWANQPSPSYTSDWQNHTYEWVCWK
jgi:hypothetical protein